MTNITYTDDANPEDAELELFVENADAVPDMGELVVILAHLLNIDDGPPFHVKHGDRIAQLVFAPVVLPDLVQEVKNENERFMRWLVDVLGAHPGSVAISTSGRYMAHIRWPTADLARLWERAAASDARLRGYCGAKVGGDRYYEIMVPSSVIDDASITEPWQPNNAPPYTLRRVAKLEDLPPSGRGAGGFGSTGR